MGRDEDVVQRAEGMVERRRLVVEDVEEGTKAPGPQRYDEDCLVPERRAPG